MHLKLIIHCVLLLCLEFSASIPHDINPQKLPGINYIKSPNAAYRQAKIPHSHQVWNQRPPYPLPTQNQEFPQINSNIPNYPKRFVPNVPQHIPQAQFPNRYPKQYRIPSNIAYKFANVPNQVAKNNIKNIPFAQNEPVQKIPDKMLVGKIQPNSHSQFRQNIISNPAALKRTVPRIVEDNLSTQNIPKIVNVSVVKNNHDQIVPEGPFSVSSKSSDSKSKATVPFEGVAIKNGVFKSFVPLIPSRPLHTGTSNTKLNKHHVKIIPSIENIIPRVAPVPSGDRYFASASNPVETITRKLTPPRYDVKQFVTNSNIRNILATTKHKKRYLVIMPNGTIEHVDKLETVVQRNPNYVLIQAGDIISNPIQKVEKVQEVVTKPVHSKNLQNVSVHIPVSNTVKEPTANHHQSTLPPANNHIKFLKPVSVPPKQLSATAEVEKPPITAKNSTTIPSTPKAPTSHPSRNETSPTVAPSKIEIIFSNTSKNNNNPKEKINQKNPDEQTPVTTLNSSVSKPVHEETKLLTGVEKPIVSDDYEKQKPNNKSIIISEANVTNDQETEAPPATLANPVKKIPVQETPLNEIVVENSVQTPKDNISPIKEDEAVAEAVTNTKPVVKDSTSVSNKEKTLPIEKCNKIDVIPKPIEESELSNSASNATAEVKLTPSLKTAVIAKTTANSTKTSTPTPKQHNITPSIPEKTLEKDKKPNTIVADSNDNPPKNTTDSPSNTEDKKEDHTPAIWFKTSDPAFWEQLKGENKEDVVLFFQIHNRPKVEYNTTRTIYPNGTIGVETMKSLWEIEGDPPIVTKTTQIINPADPKR